MLPMPLTVKIFRCPKGHETRSPARIPVPATVMCPECPKPPGAAMKLVYEGAPPAAVDPDVDAS